jgi:glutamate-1-semialdehyde 2,1-aminomutase
MESIPGTATSKLLFEEVKEFLVNGVASALHKTGEESYPIYVERGHGSRLYDVDGREYIDYLMGYGPMILGYCPPAVAKAVIEQIGRGSQFAAPFKLLNELSKKLVEIIPCAELVSYQSTGTEANMLAFRLARAFTGKDKIVKFEGHYHGWSDEELISYAGESSGSMGPRNKPWKIKGSAGQTDRALADVIVLPWNDPALVEKTIKRHGDEIAAIITEPVMCNCEPIRPLPGYLEALRDIAREHEIVLIFDEVITGFRLALGGAQEYYGVVPDICTFGKAAAGGYSLAGVAGRRELMESGVHPVGTFNANPIAVAAAVATIKELENPAIYREMERITKRLAEGVTNISQAKSINLYCSGIASIWQLQFGITEAMTDYRETFKVDKKRYQEFRMRCLAKGVRFHPSRGRFYTSAAHTDHDVDQTLSVVETVLSEMTGL